MEVIYAIILGMIQGLTEFLPVSSSGHLEITYTILGIKEGLAMTVILHFATALSIIVVFRKDIQQLAIGFLKFRNKDSVKFVLNIFYSMIPAALAGFFFKNQIDAFFGGGISFVGYMLIITGSLLLITEQIKRKGGKIKPGHAFLIGISQAIAILPGISRSGATICTAILLGVEKEQATKFSFLMVVPVIFGVMAQDIITLLSSKEESLIFSKEEFLYFFIAFFCAFFIGVFACKWMVNLVKNSKLKYFAFYCFLIGFACIILNNI